MKSLVSQCAFSYPTAQLPEVNRIMRMGIMLCGTICSAFVLAVCPSLLLSSQASRQREILVDIEHISLTGFGHVRDIVRDQQGFLWFGTSNGLHKYDGYEIHQYENTGAPDSARIYQNRIVALVNNPDGTLTLGTWDGLWIFDPRTGQFAPLLNGPRLRDRRFESLIRDSSGELWMGTRAAGIYRYNAATDELRNYSVPEGLGDSAAYALLVDHAGFLWIGTRNGGLDRMDPATSTITHYRHDPSDPSTLTGGFIVSLLEARDHALWVGTYEGLNRLDPETGRVRRITITGELNATASALSQDAEGRIWVGYGEGGVFALSDSVVMHFPDRETENPHVSDGGVQDILVDPVSTPERTLVWVGTRVGGVDKIVIKRNPFHTAIRGQNLPVRGRGAVLSLWEDHQGIIWTGLWGGGLNGFRRAGTGFALAAAFKYRAHARTGIPSDDVHCLLEDRSGYLWTGTRQGLAVLDPDRKRFTTFHYRPQDPTGIAGEIITVLLEDHTGVLWVGTETGVSRLVRRDPCVFESYLKKSLAGAGKDHNVKDIMEDKAGTLWVATEGDGLHRLDRQSNRFVSFAGDGREGMTRITLAMQDHQGLFWLWGKDGLAIFDSLSGRFSPVNTGLVKGAYVNDLTRDTQGHVWLSTVVGLLRFTPETGSLDRYDHKDGFPFQELSSEFFLTRRGSLLVGGLDGFAEFSPDAMPQDTSTPPIAITRMLVFDQAQSLSMPSIRLAHDRNSLSFSFAVLDFVEPGRNRYAYTMEGVDGGWIDAGTRHYAGYTNLGPGTYTFRVRGSNDAGVWNQEGAALQIIIDPPFWRTWWFALLAVGLLGGTLVAGHRYRVRKLLEMQRIRLRIAHDLHDDVGSNLSAIAFVSRALQNAPEVSESTRKRLRSIYNTAVRTSEGMRDIVWFITPERDNIDDLVLHLKDTASSLLGEIGHRFEDHTGGVDVHLSLELRRNVFLAYKEILTNIVRHAGATLVEIDVSRQNGILSMRIRDNGRGFEEPAAHTGNGLNSIRNRAKSVGGTCTISSAPGTGTTISFTASIRENS